MIQSVTKFDQKADDTREQAAECANAAIDNLMAQMLDAGASDIDIFMTDRVMRAYVVAMVELKGTDGLPWMDKLTIGNMLDATASLIASIVDMGSHYLSPEDNRVAYPVNQMSIMNTVHRMMPDYVSKRFEMEYGVPMDSPGADDVCGCPDCTAQRAATTQH